jgi:hypothetical protein
MATRRSSSAFCLLLSSADNASHTSEHVLNRSALQRRASCDCKRPALILRVTLSFHMLAIALGPADRLDGRTLDVELLMTEWHRAFSLSIPIPIPIAAPTPIALRRCLDSVVWVNHEPLLRGIRERCFGRSTSRESLGRGSCRDRQRRLLYSLAGKSARKSP